MYVIIETNPLTRYICIANTDSLQLYIVLLDPGRWRGTVVERRSLASELSLLSRLSHARPSADG